MNRKTKAEALEDIKSLQVEYTNSVIEALNKGFTPGHLSYTQKLKAEVDFLINNYLKEG